MVSCFLLNYLIVPYADVEQLIRKNQVYDPKSEYANVAQSVEQLIRN